MRKQLKLNALATAVVVAAASVSVPAFAAIDNSQSGNGSLLLNLRYYGGGETQSTVGGDDMSALFDLGVNLNDVLAWNGQAGFKRTWDLRTGMMSGTGLASPMAIGTYGTAYTDLQTFVGATGNPNSLADIEYNVIALDSTDLVTAGGSRYLSTLNRNTPGSFTLQNGRLNQFGDALDLYVNANNGTATGTPRGTHGSPNGASTATPASEANSYFGQLQGVAIGDNWAVQFGSNDTTQKLATNQNFWYFTTSSTSGAASVVKTPFGFDLDGDNLIEFDNNGAATAGGDREFGQWSVDAVAGTVSFTNPNPIPVPAAVWLLGSALVGMVGVARRKRA